MNTAAVEKIANAVLYEGYVLYPYRPSALKNQQRFNFGVLYPRAYSELQSGADSDHMTTECLMTGNDSAGVEIKIRFLQMMAHGRWQEGMEREVCIPFAVPLTSTVQTFWHRFSFSPANDGQNNVGDQLDGEAEIIITRLGEALSKLTLTIRNCTPLENAAARSRDEALLRSMVSVHSILQITGGDFISLLDPPQEFKDAAKQCTNRGAWPVLVGEEGRRDLMLSAPIILYDYPQIAAESAGDLCDGLEIDEILALRILTMTDAEKLEVRAGDDRARQILERTEMMPPEQFQKLHGALRGLQTTSSEQS